MISNGYYMIPVNRNKRPSIRDWRQYQSRPMTEDEIDENFRNCFGVAILTGGPPKLVGIDFDLKYSFDPTLYDRIEENIKPEILSKMYIQSTKNKGYHWLFKAPESKLVGNDVLAGRYTTAFEKHQMYMEYFNDPDTRDNAMKIAVNDTERVLVETRSGSPEKAGGYILLAPTEGYTKICSHEKGIQELTEEEFEHIEEVFRSFNEVIERNPKPKYNGEDWHIDPWEDANSRLDIQEILLSAGWTIENESVKSIRFKRPGANSGSSALYDRETGIFNCFSTSTRFDCQKGYTVSGVFAEIEHDGNKSAAYAHLIELGYGVKEFENNLK